MNKHEINLVGSHAFSVRVWKPTGGNYVLDIKLRGIDDTVVLRNLHCDVAETLRDLLSEELQKMEYEDYLPDKASLWPKQERWGPDDYERDLL
jgi:hypothetical protein